jgi:hypothetical protein
VHPSGSLPAARVPPSPDIVDVSSLSTAELSRLLAGGPPPLERLLGEAGERLLVEMLKLSSLEPGGVMPVLRGWLRRHLLDSYPEDPEGRFAEMEGIVEYEREARRALEDLGL